MKALVIFALAVISFVAQTDSVAYAQNKTWRIYSPPDKSFSIKLPKSLRKVMSFEGEHGANLEPDQKIQWTSCYAAIETTPEDSRFGIIVIDGKAKFLVSQPRDKVFSYLSAILIGDDDEPEPTSATVVHANGLAGNEYFYAKKAKVFANGSTSEIFTRGRIFETGGMIYVIVFRGQNTADLTSSETERFLNSFRPRGGRG